MEGMPKFAAIIPDVKKPANEYDEEFVYSLKEYILLHFQADPSDYDGAINELRSMKQEILKGHVDVEAVCILKRYFAQLLMMKNRFPMEQGGAVRANFTWHERALEMPTAQTYSDINFEMACVMYQIGAVHATIAAMEDRHSDDSIKNAFMHFQYAAWPFQYIRDTMDVAAFATSDFDKDLLTFHVNVLLGQAQECLLEKSLLDSKRSPLTVVKLATYLRDLYSMCHNLLKNSNAAVELLSSKRFKLWTRTVAVKSEVYGSIAMLYMGYKEEEDQHFGNRLAWCQAADHYLTRALKVPGCESGGDFADTLGFVRDVVKARLENAKKENDFIYHERVPKFEDLLVAVQGEGKVRTRSFDPLDPSIGGDDIFGSLVPPTVLASVSQYEEEKAKLKREVFNRVAAKDEELRGFLGSLNASELGLTAGPSFTVPEILLERNAAMHTQNDAVPQVLEKLQLVDQLARNADSQLNALSSRLKAIDLPAFTDDEGYKAITAEINTLLDHQGKARTLNAELHKALAAHSTNIHLLSLPLRELTEKIAPQSDITPAQTKEGEALMKILDKAHEMQSQRAMLLDSFSKELEADNISKKLLAERDTDSKTTFEAELKKHEKTIQYIDANLAAQDKILHHLTEANADFAEQRKVIQEVNKERFDQVMTLVAAYDIYMDVSNKAQDGKNFYEKLLQRVGKIGKAVEAIEAAFSKEREKLESERRAVEEKKAAIKAARDARDALSDFGGMPPSSQLPPGPPASAGRPRLGDYMQFYKNKMNAKSGLPPSSYSPSMPPPAPLNMPPEHVGYRQPPSPAPSSIAGDLHNDGYDYNSGRFISPVPPPPQVMPSDQYRQYPGYGAVPQQNNPSYGAFPPPPNGFSSSHSSTSELNRIMNNGTPTTMPPTSTQLPTPQRATPEIRSRTPQNDRYQPSYAPPRQHVQPYGGPGHQVLPQPQQYLPQSTAQQFQSFPSGPQQPQHNAPQVINATQQFPIMSQIQQPHQPLGSGQAPQPPFSQISNASPQPPFQQYQQPGSQMAQQQAQIHAPQSPFVPISSVSPQPTGATFQHYQPPQQQTPQSQAPQPPQQPMSQGPQQGQIQSPFVPISNVQPAFPQNQPTLPPQQVPQQQLPTSQQLTPQSSIQAPFYQNSNVSPQPPSQQYQQPQTPQQPGSQLQAPQSPFIPISNVFPQPAKFQQYQPTQQQTPQLQAPQPPQQSMSQVPQPSLQPSFPPVSNVSPQPATLQPQQPVAQPPQNPSASLSSHQTGTWNNPQTAPWSGPQQAPSPWHNTPRASPWHQQSPSTFASPSQPIPQTRETPVLGQGTPVSQPGGSSNVDLLSSLLGDLHLPPAMAPSQPPPKPATTEYHSGFAPSMENSQIGLQQAAPRPVEQPPAAVIRPAAAVLPIQQKAPQSEMTEPPMLSMVQPSTISIAPQGPSAPLADLTNPDKFNLGESDRHRLEKRQLHAAIKGNGPLPSLDPLDPLNQLDPFWGIKKN